MLNRLTIGTRLASGFGLIVLIMTLSIATALLSFRSMRRAMAEVKSQTVQIGIAKDAHSLTLDAMAYIGAAAGASDSASLDGYLKTIKTSRDGYQAKLDELKAMATDAGVRDRIQIVEDAIVKAKGANTEVMALAKAGRSGEAFAKFSKESCPNIATWDSAFKALDTQ